MSLLGFTITDGDFEYSCDRQQDSTYLWRKKLLNTPGAVAEEVECLDDVPLTVLRAFSAKQVRNQAAGSQGPQPQA